MQKTTVYLIRHSEQLYNECVIEVNSPCLIKLEFEKKNLKDLNFIV